MRFFPRIVRRRFAAVLLAGSLAAGAVSIPLAHAEDDLEDKQKQVEKQIDRAHDDLDESSAQLRRATIRLRGAQVRLDAAQVRLRAARARLTAAQIRDRQMQARLDAAVAALAQAREDLADGRQAVAEKRIEIGTMVATMYQQGDPQLLGMASVMSARDPGDVTRRLQLMSNQVGEQDRKYDELRVAEVLLEVNEQKVERAKDAVQVQREAAAAHLVTMRDLEARADRAADAVAALVSSRATAHRAAERAKDRDRAALRALEREADRIQQMLAERARRLRQLHGGGPPQASGGFLNYPVNGYVTSPFGYRIHPIYGYYALHDGVDFGAGCGAPLYASAGGRVISRYYQTAFGNRLIIDHGYQRGVGLATIYNHATQYVVGVGERVERGQLVGYVGSTGWSTGCHLHFTVMANGNPVDPMKWF